MHLWISNHFCSSCMLVLVVHGCCFFGFETTLGKKDALLIPYFVIRSSRGGRLKTLEKTDMMIDSKMKNLRLLTLAFGLRFFCPYLPGFPYRLWAFEGGENAWKESTV